MTSWYGLCHPEAVKPKDPLFSFPHFFSLWYNDIIRKNKAGATKLTIFYIIPTYIFILILLYTLIMIKFNAPINPPKIQEQKFDYNSLISKYEIFEAKEKSKIQPSANINNIQLIGTAIGFKNLAIIKLDGKTHIVSQGQNINGIRIVNIGMDFILVESDGKTEKITFKTKAQQTASNNEQPLNLPPLDKVLSNNTIPKSEIEKLTADPGVMLTQIRLIQVGDILVAINNQKINSGEDAFRILQMLRNESSIKVTILRNGQLMDMSYFIN
jgi:general secretion pathway protein C